MMWWRYFYFINTKSISNILKMMTFLFECWIGIFISVLLRFPHNMQLFGVHTSCKLNSAEQVFSCMSFQMEYSPRLSFKWKSHVHMGSEAKNSSILSALPFNSFKQLLTLKMRSLYTYGFFNKGQQWMIKGSAPELPCKFISTAIYPNQSLTPNIQSSKRWGITLHQPS